MVSTTTAGRRSDPGNGTRPRADASGDKGPTRERGMVSVELAIGVLAMALVALVGAFIISMAVVQGRCGDTAAAVSRQLARGDRQEADRARGTAPRGATVQVTTSGGRVRVTVSVSERLGRFGPVRLSSTAEAAVEPGVSP